MSSKGGTALYRAVGVGLLRAAARPLADESWPDLEDPDRCRGWIKQTWQERGLADAVGAASPAFAQRLESIVEGGEVHAKQVRRVAWSLMRYVLRSTGRHTPFGMFAGVAPLGIGDSTHVVWTGLPVPVARMDAQWVADVADQLEACPQLLAHLDVVFSSLAVQRGERLEMPRGGETVSIRASSAVKAVREAASSPIAFGVLATRMTSTLGAANRQAIVDMLTSLVKQRFLVTALRAPMTIVDPLGHLLAIGEKAGAGVAAVGPLLTSLRELVTDLDVHNSSATSEWDRRALRSSLVDRASQVSDAGRTPLAVDLRLPCQVDVPSHVVHELEHAATVLARLSSQPSGHAEWRNYYTAFCERYGTGTLVPLSQVVDAAVGLGLPTGYPGAVMPEPPASRSDRADLLLELAWRTLADGSREIVLDDALVEQLTVGNPEMSRRYPSHVEIAARVHAADVDALDRGDYLLTVSPARAAGTLTSRFATLVPEARLAEAYAAVPASVEGGLAVQMSFPPIYPFAENICRTPAYLPVVLSIGEHRAVGDGVIDMDDLALTATREGLHLVSLSRKCVIEPQVFHALALDKQLPPIARFLAHLSRGLDAGWHEFDWGPHTAMPHLPRVRYGRAIISRARWSLTNDDISPGLDAADWQVAVKTWSHRWGCPDVVELQDADRSLRLDLNELAHRQIIHAHLRKHERATLLEVATAADLGWINGHVHDVVVPLVTTQPPRQSVAVPALPLIGKAHGQFPGSPSASWLYAKVFSHPDQFNNIITNRLPSLLESLGGDPGHWFIRYREQHEADHLRLRLRAPDRDTVAEYLSALGLWADDLRRAGLAGRMALDTYFPETGRYGRGPALAAAEQVFAADSVTVADQLRQLAGIDRKVLTAMNMIATVEGILGGRADAMQWLVERPSDRHSHPSRDATAHAVRLIRSTPLAGMPSWLSPVSEGWRHRARALNDYRAQIPDDMDVDSVIESLLHMHHNRLCGIDRTAETECRVLARRAALAWLSDRSEATR